MVVKDNFEFSKTLVSSSVEKVLGDVAKTVEKQGKFLLPKQVEAYNKSLMAYGLMVMPSGEVYHMSQDFVGDKNSAPVSLDKLDAKSLHSATTYYVTMQRLLLDQVLKPSCKGKDLINGSLRAVTHMLPKTKGVDSVSPMLTATYNFMVDPREVRNLYMYGSPSPKSFRALSPVAYDVATGSVKNLTEKTM